MAQQDNGTWQSVRNGKEEVDAPYLRAVDYDNIGSQLHEVTAVSVDFTSHSSYQVPGAMETFGPRDFLAGSNSRWGHRCHQAHIVPRGQPLAHERRCHIPDGGALRMERMGDL